MSKILKMVGVITIGAIALLLIAAILFVNLSPQFGKAPAKEQKKEYSQLENFQDGKFINQHHSPMNMDFVKLFKDMTKKSPNRNPEEDIPVERIDSVHIENLSKDTSRLIWFGHSTFLLLIDGKKILIDPMLSQKPSPVSFLGTTRYSKNLPISAEKLPFIDAVILSHDHYDHLDYESIQQLKEKVGRFFTPLGVGNHLMEWGVDKERISELNWWNNVDFGTIKLTFTPARHFSGRGIFDRQKTLWGSWVIEGKKDKIFFSGDSGYDTHFKKIGEEFGPFDIALMECGQYNENWKHLHMMPQETALASIDLKAKLFMPIHWGGFTLAFHDWTDPAERVLKKADELNIAVTTPKIGEPVTIGSSTFPKEKWWLYYINSDVTD